MRLGEVEVEVRPLQQSVAGRNYWVYMNIPKANVWMFLPSDVSCITSLDVTLGTQ